MLLDVIESIATELSLPFHFGAASDLNMKADRQAGQYIFFEGYASANLIKDGGDFFDADFDLKLWVLLPSKLSDTPTQHRPRFDTAYTTIYAVLNRLVKEGGQLSNLRVEEGAKLEVTDRMLDGLYLTGKCKFELDTLCI